MSHCEPVQVRQERWSVVRIDRHHDLFIPLQQDLLCSSSSIVSDHDETPIEKEDVHLDCGSSAQQRRREVAGWSFLPYPLSSEASIQSIHFWWLCVDTAALPSNTSSSSISLDSVAGVVGVVLSPFGCRSNEMEAYIQVVLVRPADRRQGVGATMVRRVLDDLCDQQQQQQQQPNASLKLTRVRLHTMVNSINTRKYLLEAHKSNNDNDSQLRVAQEDVGDVRDSNSNDGSLNDMMTSVRNMYEGFGFTVRRNCPKYYASQADGIEMVLERDRLLQRFWNISASSRQPRKRDRTID